MAKTLFDKIWEAHEVAEGLIYIDLHLVHEVTSPQAFDGPAARRALGPPPRAHARDGRPQRAHRRHADGEADRRRALAGPGRDPGAKLRGVRHPDLLARLRPPGHRARDRPRAGRDPARDDDRLRRQPHLHARRVRRPGVRDRHLGGRARPRDPVPGPAPAEDDADRLLRRARRRRHAQGPDPGDDRPPRHRRHGRSRRRVRGRDDPRPLDGEPDDDLQHDDRGRWPRRDDRARRDHVRVGRGDAPARPTTSTRRSSAGASCPPTTGRASTARSRSTPPRSRRWSPGARTPARSSR